MAANKAFVVAVIIAFLLITLLGYHVLRDKENTLSCWQFISSKGIDGIERADIDKLGKLIALLVLTGIIILQAYKNSLNEGMVLIWLGYAGGSAGWAAYLRTRGGIKPRPPTVRRIKQVARKVVKSTRRKGT